MKHGLVSQLTKPTMLHVTQHWRQQLQLSRRLFLLKWQD
jgi:hypothetical protein